jgi:glutamate synthase (NADPH) large chain
MMRVCQLDTCPVGVATQNPVLRERFTGRPEFVVTFFEYLAEEVREVLASLGFRSLDEAVGQVGSLDVRRAVEHWKASGLDLSPVLADVEVPDGAARRQTSVQDHGLEKALDHQLIAASRAALDSGERVTATFAIRNVNRTVGTMLGHEVTKRFGPDGAPDGTVDLTLVGSAGQSFGAFLPAGVTLRLVGDANDYVGKGLSGGRVVVKPHESAPFAASRAGDNVIAGNTVAYGATSGEVFLSGRVGERFAVRNSGATVVVEGTGDHACEYMTGGVVVVLGRTGRNVGAGMSGGTAFVLDLAPEKLNAAAVRSGELTSRPLSEGTDAERALVARLVARHLEETGSAVAASLLDGDALTGEALSRFTALVPRDYARVTALRERATAEGNDPDGADVWQQIMEAVRG